jgi:TPR repeat protein
MGLKFKSILHLAAVLSLWSTSALAANISLVPWGSDPEDAIVTVEGDLELDDDIRFQAQVGRLKWARVRFNSDGGNPLAGIAIGKIIRLKSFETVVLNGQRCASACAFAWLGGSHRFMEDGARIGFHAAYVQKAGQPTVSGVGNALLGSYLAQLGLPESAVIYITQAGPTDITWLTWHEARQMGIEVVRFTQPPALPLAGDIQTRAEQGDARWQEALGLKYLLGDGIPHNPAEGLKWLRRSADQGFLLAIDDLGEFYWLGSYEVPQNDVEAVKFLQKAADSGVPLAQYRMGLAYYLGRGVPVNYTNAAGWFFNAARQGHAVAQNNLGVHYFRGLGVQQNIAQAVKWYTCSAEQGYRSAQKTLGMEYRDGIGVQQDYVQAYKWFDLAATNEESKTVRTSVVANVANDNGQWDETSDVAIESMQLRDQLATYMTPAQLTAAQQLARKWRPKEKTCVGSN